MGHRAVWATCKRDKGDTASCLALPCAERRGDGAVVVVLFQGTADRRRVARGADRQAERRHHHLSVVPVSEFLFLKEPVSLRVVAGALLITGGSIIMLIK